MRCALFRAAVPELHNLLTLAGSAGCLSASVPLGSDIGRGLVGSPPDPERTGVPLAAPFYNREPTATRWPRQVGGNGPSWSEDCLGKGRGGGMG